MTASVLLLPEDYEYFLPHVRGIRVAFARARRALHKSGVVQELSLGGLEAESSPQDRELGGSCLWEGAGL